MNHISTNLLMGALILLAGIAFAQTPVPNIRGPLAFSVFDQNGDGVISQQEFATVHAQRQQAPGRGRNEPPNFTDFDQNGDGGLSPDELAQGQQKQMQLRRQQAAGAGQGNERPRSPGMGRGMGPGRGHNMPAFSDFDLNGDGVLRPQEFGQARAQRIRERLQQGYMMRNLKNAPPFTRIDSNGDGLISPQEFVDAQVRHRLP